MEASKAMDPVASSAGHCQVEKQAGFLRASVQHESRKRGLGKISTSVSICARS